MLREFITETILARLSPGGGSPPGRPARPSADYRAPA